MSVLDVGHPEVVDADVPVALSAETLCAMFAVTVARHADRPALRAFGDGRRVWTWAEYDAQMRAVAAGLAALGVARGDTVGIMLTNRPEFHVADAAAMYLGAVPFSIYNSSSPEQILGLLTEADPAVLITEARFLERIASVAGDAPPDMDLVSVDGGDRGVMSLGRLTALGDPAFDVDACARAVTARDLLTIISTSGTTGTPKWVQITHANMLAEIRAVHAAVPAPEGGRVISWLPAAHLAERWGSHYSGMAYGRETVCLADPAGILDALPVERPVRFGSVPRVWEKLRARLDSLVAELPPDRRAATQAAIADGRRRVALEQSGAIPPADLVERLDVADREHLAPLRAGLGLDRCRLCTTGAAPTPPELIVDFLAIGVAICEQWGMSETSCIATLNPPGALRIGTAGTALPGVELRLADDGELLVRGDIVMEGYRGRPELTRTTIDPDGWLRTGDIAEIDGDGYVRIVDRKKDLIISSGGKNMSPALIESRLKSASPLIGQACCIGDARPFNVALLVLDPEGARAFAASRGLPADPGALVRTPGIREAVQAAVAEANGRLSRVEQIKRWTLLGHEWPADGDELTATMKLRRRVIAEKYAVEIDALYATDATVPA